MCGEVEDNLITGVLASVSTASQPNRRDSEGFPENYFVSTCVGMPCGVDYGVEDLRRGP